MSAWIRFNKEIVCGELGSLGMAYVAAHAANALHARPVAISAAIVAGTLIGGTLWLALRIHQREAPVGMVVQMVPVNIGASHLVPRPRSWLA